MDTTIAPRLSGKVALVTGGSRGIGAAIAAKLARNGAKAVVNYHSKAETAGRVVEGIVAAGGEAFAVQADVSQVAAAAPLVEAAVQHFGSLDIGHVHQRGGHFVWRPATCTNWSKLISTTISRPVVQLSREWGLRGIRVNAVAPGATATEMLLANNPPEHRRTMVERVALGRMGQPRRHRGCRGVPSIG
jgi:NAD(P)-dependent dehydrogenase (short-subunit alcohol dehydrogenase family)